MQTTATKPSFLLRRLLPESDGAPWLRVVPEDGWLTLLLLTTVVYTTIASIQGAGWAPGTNILTPMTFAGLILGYLAVQQGRLPRSLIHILAIALGIAFAFKETADATLGGNWRSLLDHTRIWFKQTIIDQQSSSDNQVFLLFLAILSLLLAYISVWLVVHTRRPWLAALANGVVLLINLNWASSDKTVLFTVIFLLATLLLLVRFTLAENMRQWRARGLRFSPTSAGTSCRLARIFAVIVLLLGFMLPASQANQAILDAWNSPTNPWNGAQDAFGKLFAGISGTGVGNGPGGQGFFGSDLKLRGTVNLPTNIILRYKLPGTGDDPSQYLITETFDAYNGNNTWTSTPTQTVSFQPSESLPASNAAVPLKSNTYQIIYSVIPSGTHVFAPGTEAQSFDIPTQTFISSASQTPVHRLATSPLSTGKPYTSTAYISTATADQLRKVPYPANVAPADQATAYPPGLLAEYLFSTRPSTIPADVRQQAHDATRGTTNMYDAATSIEWTCAPSPTASPTPIRLPIRTPSPGSCRRSAASAPSSPRRWRSWAAPWACPRASPLASPTASSTPPPIPGSCAAPRPTSGRRSTSPATAGSTSSQPPPSTCSGAPSPRPAAPRPLLPSPPAPAARPAPRTRPTITASASGRRPAAAGPIPPPPLWLIPASP